MAVKKKYTIYAHAIHSRLQLIKDKLVFHANMVPQDFVGRNMKYFQRAIESVMNQHDYRQPHIDDTVGAAEMFVSTITEDPADPEKAKNPKPNDFTDPDDDTWNQLIGGE